MISAMPANGDPDARALRTRHLDQVIDAVTRVYCPHTVEVVGRARGIDAFLKITHSTFQPLVGLSYSTPVKIDAQNMSRLFLMMHCASGAASTTQEHRTADWKTGQTMPFSANFDTKLWFDRAFVQKSVRLDMDWLEAQCARWLGYPLLERLRFNLRPFSDELEQIWQRTLAYGWSIEAGLPLAGAAKAALDEYLLTLLLHHHPHTTTAKSWRKVCQRPYLASCVAPSGSSSTTPARRSPYRTLPIISASACARCRPAFRHLAAGPSRIGAAMMAPNRLARNCRCWPLTTRRTLVANCRFRGATDIPSWPRETTPNAFLRRGRLQHLGRFSALYRSAFGEDPSACVGQSRRMRC
jgi:AraC-binding-like domain